MLDNLWQACSQHHHLVHEGGFAVEALPDGGFRVLRPDGTEVLPVPPAPAVTREPVQALAEDWVVPGVRIGPDTGMPTWQGEKPDYEWMGFCLDSLALNHLDRLEPLP